jgi:hypothetical protein
MNDDELVYPLLTSNARGSGKILNLNLWPLFSSLVDSKYQDSGRLNWRVLPNIWSIIQLDNEAGSILDSLGVAIAQDSIQLTGDAIVKGTSLLFDGDCDIEYRDEESGRIWSGYLDNMSIIGNIDITIKSRNLTLSTSELLNSIMLTGNQNMTVTVSIPELYEMNLAITNNDGSEMVALGNGTHVLHFAPNDSSFTLSLINPKVTCNGATSFKKIYAAKPFDFYIPGFSTNVTGLTEFTIIAAQNTIEITNLTIVGSFDIYRGSQLTEITSVFNSVWTNILFVPVLSGVFLVIIILQSGMGIPENVATLRRVIRRISQREDSD